MSPNNSLVPLKVSVVGAGIGGLAAAIALRRNGHLVEVFEASENKSEVGAGIGVQVNALRVLEHWGLCRENLKGVSYDGITTFDSKTGESISRGWLVPGAETNKSLLCHRSDVHDELTRLVIGKGEGTPVQLHLGSKVLDCDPEKGTISLKNGKTIYADVVIGADGLHSAMRTHILGHVQMAPASGLSCFRSLIDATKLQGHFDWFTEGASGARSVVVNEGAYRLLFMYPIQSGRLVNLVALYADPHQDDPGWTSQGTREELLQIFHDIRPKFLSFLALADTPILKWQLRVLPLLPTWVRGRATLLGDAAHATLPTLGQGAALAIEEAGALGCLLPLGTRREDVPSRLDAYQALRKPRGDYVNRESLDQGTQPSKRGLYFRCVQCLLALSCCDLPYSAAEEVQSYLLQHDAIKDAKAHFEQHFNMA